MAGATCCMFPTAARGFPSYAGINRGGVMAAAFAIIAPVILLTTMLERYAGKGMMMEAVKG